MNNKNTKRLTTFIEGTRYAMLELTKDKYAIIDMDMWDELSQYNWYYAKPYAGRNITVPGKYTSPSGRIKAKQKTTLLHWHVLNFFPERKTGRVIDHINGNTMDNRRCNLRIVDHHINQCNTIEHHNNKNGYSNVHKIRHLYVGKFTYKGKPYHSKSMSSPQQAHQWVIDRKRELGIMI